MVKKNPFSFEGHLWSCIHSVTSKVKFDWFSKLWSHGNICKIRVCVALRTTWPLSRRARGRSGALHDGQTAPIGFLDVEIYSCKFVFFQLLGVMHNIVGVYCRTRCTENILNHTQKVGGKCRMEVQNLILEIILIFLSWHPVRRGYMGAGKMVNWLCFSSNVKDNP